MNTARALPDDPDTIDIRRSECGDAFWRELRGQVWRHNAKKAVLMNTAREVRLPLALYHQVLPMVRARLAARPSAPPEAVNRAVTVHLASGATVAVVGWSLAEDSAVVANRPAGSEIGGDLWHLTHVASGKCFGAGFSASSARAAARHAAAVEAACPSLATLDPEDAEQVAAFRDEFAAFNEKRGM